LSLDFDFVETGVQEGTAKYMDWYGAFGIMVTLIWLYLEMLRPLAKARRRSFRLGVVEQLFTRHAVALAKADLWFQPPLLSAPPEILECSLLATLHSPLLCLASPPRQTL
jgi:Bax inhibitor 1 like